MSVSISFQCDHCQKKYRVPESSRGKRAKCSGCGTVLQVPQQSAAKQDQSSEHPRAETQASERPLAANNAELLDQIRAQFEQKIPRVRAGILYQFGLIFVASFLILLPIIYVGLIVAAGWAVKYHAMEHTGILTAVRGGRAMIFAGLAYIAPIFAGVVLIFFMIKPLFARTVRLDRRRSLTRKGQEPLFEFVDQICAAVRAPKPKRIDVCFDVNAAAGLRRGFLSLFSTDLVLVIGLPLVAGLTAQQFAGVLGHEFGHFSQRLAMRLGWCIQRVNGWFERLVYERDEWDYWLADACEESESVLGLLFYLAMFCVWISRLILMLFMLLSHGMSCLLSRQMEYNADQHEARLVGSKTFAKTTKKLPRLQVAFQEALMSYSQGDLDVAQIPAYVGNYEKNLTKADKKKIAKRVASRKPGWFDTHPHDEQRIARASKPEREGVISLDGPATDLFRNFDQICVSASKG